jgi:deoxyribose-phosphate aldolase
MNYSLNKDEAISCIDYTLLEKNINKKYLFTFYEKYLNFINTNNKPASFCVFPEDLDTLSQSHNKLDNPCVVVNFPHAQDTFEKIENDFKIANKYNSEVDVVFPTKLFLKDNDNSNITDLLNHYRVMADKYQIKTIKVIFDSTYFVIEDKNNDENFLVNDFIKALNLTYQTLYSDNYTLFFKTSTGKVFKNEDHTRAVCLFHSFIKLHGGVGSVFNKNLGIKVSGGVSDFNSVRHYLNTIKDSKYYLSNSLFRIGSSSLLENLANNTNKKGY